MREIEYGWCTHCNAYRHSGKSGFFSRSATGHCKHCGTKLREGRVVVAKDRFYSDTTADAMIILDDVLAKTTSFYDIPDHSHKTDEVRGHGGDFGGAGASSSWDSGSSSSYDSGSSLSDSGGGD